MKPVYHIVSHSHWDREWYKSFEQFRAMLVAMVDDLLELLDRDPRYTCFTLDGQTVVLDDYLAVRPERERKIRELVATGRLSIGPWYVLPDEFLVSGEATIRNLLTGTARARDFGGEMNVGYIPDSFGHIAMMPAILRGFGIGTALIYRGFGGEPGQTSSEYQWTAPDGSQVLMLHLFKNGYSAGYFHGEPEEKIIERFKELKDELDERATTSQRLLLNGGDHHWPDPELPRVLDMLRQKCDVELVHSSLPKFVDAISREVGEMPKVQGELRFGFRYAFAVTGGVYSSRMYLKQQNWKQQNLLQRYVEPLNAIATVTGMRSQLPLVRHAWRLLMQNHPHDSICGCSIDPVHREMMTRFKAVEDSGGAIAEEALNHIIPYDDQAAGDDRYLFFFNPSAASRSEVTACELNFYLQDIVVGLNPDVAVAPKLPRVQGFTLHQAGGAEVPYQIVKRNEGYDITYTKFNYPKQTYADKFNLLVDLKNVPALGYKGLEVRRARKFPRYTSTLRTGARFMENEFLRVEVNARGEFSVKDKVGGKTYSKLNVFEDTGDVGDEYNYSYPAKDLKVTSSTGKAAIRFVERGPLRVAMRITLDMRMPASASADRKRRGSKLTTLRVVTTAYLTPSSRALEFNTVVENTAKDHRLRVLFPVGVPIRRVHADSQFCILERERKEYDVRAFTIEHPAKVAPMQRFVTALDAPRGLSVLAYGLPEYEAVSNHRGIIALTLLRCVGLLAGEDLITRPGGKSGWHNETPDAQCLGTHTFRYAVYPHAAAENERIAGLNTRSEQFHLPLLPVRRKNSGTLSLEREFLSVSDERLTLSAVKQAENGVGVIVRLYNTTSRSIHAFLRTGFPLAGAWLARLDEHVIGEVEVKDGAEVELNVPPGSIQTLLLKQTSV